MALVLLLVVGLLGVAGAAYAYWTSHGTGAGSATSGTLAPPTAASATSPAGTNTVNVTWTASTGSPVPQGYYVVRTNTSTSLTAAACGSSPASLKTTTSCSDTSVSNGDYTYAVTAVYHSWTATSAASGSVHVALLTATKLAFTTQPSATATSQSAFGQQPVVTIQDASGVTVTSDSSSVTLTLTAPGGATLSCAGGTSKAATAGVATFSGCSIDKAGTYTLTASDGSLAPASSTSIAVSAGPAAKLTFSTQPGNGTGGIALATQPVVTVQDVFGNTVTGDASSVTLSLTTPGGATLACTTNPQPAVAGVASFTGCKVDKAATYTLTATDGSLTAATSNSFTITVGPASKLAFTTSPSTPTTSQVAFATQPVVTIQDAGGNTVTTDTSSVTLALTGSPSGANLTCTANTKAAAAGVATFVACKVDKAGTYTLAATDGTLTSAVSASFTINAGAATKLVFTTQPGNGTGGTALSTQPQVTVQDAFGNTVTGDNGSVTLTIGGGSGTLTCASNPTNASLGVAAFVGCQVDKAGATYTLTASRAGLTSGTSAAFTITVGPASKLAFTTSPSTPTASQVAFTTQPQVTVQDAGGNTVTSPTASVTLSLTTAGGATLVCTTNPVTTSGGVATFAGCKVDKAATNYTLTATATGLTSGTSAPFTVTAGTATRLLFTDATGTSPTCASGSVIVGPTGTYTAWVARTDAFGNLVSLVTSTSIAVAKGTGDGGLPTPATLTIAANNSVSSASTSMTLPNGNPADTTYTATGGGLTQASCIVRKN